MQPLHPHDPPSVGPYRLHSRLGEDAYARVYLGSVPGGPPAAVHVVRSEHATDTRFRAVFGELVEAGYRLESDRVCAVLAADLRGAVPWVAVEHAYGMGLTDLVAGVGPLSVDALHALALHLALALDDVHAAGRAHGSLWPDGVLVTTERALLADPGLEWAVAGVDRRAPHPSFAAPEGGTGPGTDVFAWAATVSYAASGLEGPEGLPRVPLQLRGLVDACLRNSPVLRPSAADLVRMLGGPRAADPWPPEVLAAVRARAGEQREVIAAAGEAPAATDPRPGSGSGSGLRGFLGGGPGRRRAVALTAGAVALAAVSGLLWVWAWPDAGREEEPGTPVMSEGAPCSDGVAYPAPEDTLDGEEAGARSVAFDPSGELLAVLTTRGLSVWDWAAREEVARLPEVDGPLDVVFSPTGCLVAAGVQRGFEGMDAPVTMATTFDLPSGTTVEHLGPQRGPSGPDGVWVDDPEGVRHLGFSPDGSLMTITLDGRIDRAKVGLVDTATGEPVRQAVDQPANRALMPDPERIATASTGVITVWDVRDGGELHTVRDMTQPHFLVVPGTDEVVFIAGERVVWWDYVLRREVRSFTMDGFVNTDMPVYLAHLGLSPDGGRLYADWYTFEATEDGGDGTALDTAYVWDIESGEDLLAGAEGGDGEPLRFRQAAEHPDGEGLVVITPQERVVLVDPDTLEPGEPLF
ncbi:MULTISPECIES: acyl-ACP thioesterase [unclassified Nocardiopsis]|uniref:acyl-ACP thioesterase n=1 Tax=Nocardiopsis TaxID=2013 RepID=UPI00387ADF61